MKSLVALLCAISLGMPLIGADNPNLNYQNYNHGYCPECNCTPCGCGEPAPACAAPACAPCDPCAPVCGAECGISLCAIGVGIAAAAAAAVLIIASGSGSQHHHN